MCLTAQLTAAAQEASTPVLPVDPDWAEHPDRPAPAPPRQEDKATLSSAKPEDTPGPLPSKQAIKKAVRETLAEEASSEPARRHSQDALSGDRYGHFAKEFSEAQVPGCLRPNGLSRQPTFGLFGILALPFILVALARGKCN